MPYKLLCVNQKVIVAVENLRQMPIYQWNYASCWIKQTPINQCSLFFFANNVTDKCNKID